MLKMGDAGRCVAGVFLVYFSGRIHCFCIPGAPKGGPVLRTFEKYSGVDGNSVLRILIRKAKCCRGRK